MADISKIKALDGVTYNLKDANAAKIVELTQAEYDALATKDPSTIYMITDSNDYNADKTDVTLYAANWSNGIYTISDNHIGTDTVQLVSPAEGITDAQLEALQGANIQAYGQDEGHLYLKAYGDVPSIDVPVSVIFHPGVQVRDVEPQNQDIYSTTEQVVGTWIDGKPIYRLCGTFTTTPPTVPAMENVFRADIFGKDNSGMWFPVIYANNSGGTVYTAALYWPRNGGQISIPLSGLSVLPYYVYVFEYTKTTD